jgi:hypothetical protein
LAVGRAEFAEKEYEIAMAIELSAGVAKGSRVYPCGQVLEEILGDDAAADPRRQHPIWAVLAAPRPRGIRLVPEYWDPGTRPPAERLPPTPVSLILQHKRPDFLQGARAKQWRLWGRPYFRFEVTSHQQRVLKRLERAAASEAVVRYACPALWERGDFERARYARTLAAESGYVSPSALDGHRVWTFDQPGAYGRGNPTGGRYAFESFGELSDSLAELAPVGTGEVVLSRSVPAQVMRLAEATRSREPRLRSVIERWVASIHELGLGLTRDQLTLLAAYTSIVTLLSAIGATWHLVQHSPSDPRRAGSPTSRGSG